MKMQMIKKELNYQGVNIVFDNPKTPLDTKRELLITSILLYANVCGRDLRVIFFNGSNKEKGVTFFFKNDEEK